VIAALVAGCCDPVDGSTFVTVSGIGRRGIAELRDCAG
jgi:hypothetical protein